jgi:hypothetical protein
MKVLMPAIAGLALIVAINQDIAQILFNIFVA